MLLAEESRWTQRGKPHPKAELTTDFTETKDHIIREIRGQNFRSPRAFSASIAPLWFLGTCALLAAPPRCVLLRFAFNQGGTVDGSGD